MIAIGSKCTDTCDRNMEAESNEEDKRFIYFNPNFCINNINVKELVVRAEQAASVSKASDTSAHTNQNTLPLNGNQNNPFISPPAVPAFTSESARNNPAPAWPGPADNPPAKKRVVLLPTPKPNTFKIPPPRHLNKGPVPAPSWIKDNPFYAKDVDWNDRDHPWYHRDPNYVSNLLNIAADYAKRPNEMPRCRMPPLSKRELLFRMEKEHKHGKLLSSLVPCAVEKFIRYMNIVKDQIDFDMLRIDYSKNQSYSECRRKRSMMKALGVNKFHYVNEKAAEELFARSQNLQGFKKQIRKDLDLSKLDTSKLTVAQRRFLFKHHVLKQGKAVYVNPDKDRNPSSSSISSPLVSVNKFKAVSKASLVPTKNRKLRLSLRYRRSDEPILQDCRFYIKTGKCKFGVRCIRKHDPSKLPTRLKKAAARKMPKSSFSVINIPKLPRRPYSSLPPPLIPLSELKPSKLPVVNLSKTPRSSASVPSSSTASPPTSNTGLVTAPAASTPLHTSNYRFINNPKLGPTKVGLNKKLVNRALKWKRKTATRRKQDCMFFIRRGKCAFGEECRKRHDPTKVTLCNHFIFYNRCNNSQCPFQHKVCTFTLLGYCLVFNVT